jgi:phosphate/sulfate permease
LSDVANAFATSVGSRTLKLKAAILIAVVSIKLSPL